MIKRLRNILKNTKYSFTGQRLDAGARSGRPVLGSIVLAKQVELPTHPSSSDLSPLISIVF
jgi:hypothetical protein